MGPQEKMKPSMFGAGKKYTGNLKGTISKPGIDMFARKGSGMVMQIPHKKSKMGK